MYKIILPLSILIVSCGSIKPAETAKAPECDPAYRPIVFVHGFLASGDTYADQVMRFASNGYCPDRLYAFDWNTLGGAGTVALLDSFINSILATTGAPKVDLAGHSAGGGLGYSYLSDPARAAKVAHYAHLGSRAQTQPAGPDGSIPTLNLYSSGDRVAAGADIPGATNKRFETLDHYQIATAPEVFAEMFAFFNDGKLPETTAVQAQKRIGLSGKVVSLGENAPQSGATVDIYEVAPETGRRLRPQPDASLRTRADGRWGPWQAKPGVRYEFFVRSANSADRPIHYYREAFSRSNPLVYLRTFPGAGSPAGLLLAALPKNDDQSVVAVFNASRAIVHARDTLAIDGTTLSTEAITPAAKTVISMFLYDNGDGKSSGTPHPGFQLMRSFLTGVDHFIPTAAPGSMRLFFNGRTLNVPNWKSATDGVIVAVFD